MPTATVATGGGAAFFTDPNGMLDVFQNGKLTMTGQMVKSFSAGVDMQGMPEAFFLTMNNQLGRWDNGNMTMFNAFGTQVSSAAGIAYFTDGNHRIIVYKDSDGSFNATMGFANNLAFTVSATGVQQVSFTDGNNQLWFLLNGQFFESNAFATRLSESLDAQGNAELWFTDGNNQIWRWEPGFFAMSPAFGMQISGSTGGNVFFIDGNHELMMMNNGTGAGSNPAQPFMNTNTGAFAMQIGASSSTSALYFLDGNNALWLFQNGMFTMTGIMA
jgi:hypothetical protein